MPRPTRWRCPLLGVCLLILLCVFALLFLGIRRLESADEATRTRGARWLIGPTRAVAAAYGRLNCASGMLWGTRVFSRGRHTKLKPC